jgi:hypothetical protein
VKKIRLKIKSLKKSNPSTLIKNKKKKRTTAQESKIRCAAAASATVKVKRTSHTHAVVASQLSAV